MVSEGVVRSCSVKKIFLKVSQNSEELVGGPQAYFKRNSDTGVFL